MVVVVLVVMMVVVHLCLSRLTQGCQLSLSEIANAAGACTLGSRLADVQNFLNMTTEAV